MKLLVFLAVACLAVTVSSDTNTLQRLVSQEVSDILHLDRYITLAVCQGRCNSVFDLINHDDMTTITQMCDNTCQCQMNHRHCYDH